MCAYQPHQPVLLAETLEFLAIRPGARVLDATSGGGGHGAAFLERIGPGGFLLALDRDPEAVDASRRRLAGVGGGGRFEVRRARFGSLAGAARDAGAGPFDAVFFDLGVSSHHLDSARRGFSFDHDGPLDMRLDPEEPLRASDLVRDLGEAELAGILAELGEEPRARRVARAIVRARSEAPIETTGRLAEIVRRAAAGGPAVKSLARVFQALRMTVNDELGELTRALPQALDLLADGGRVGVICFHSVEARAVKRQFRHWQGRCVCAPGVPACRCSPRRVARLVTTRAVGASVEEVSRNPRARSARLRVAEKYGAPLSS